MRRAIMVRPWILPSWAVFGQELGPIRPRRPHIDHATSFQPWLDAGHNIFDRLPWWAWVAAAVGLAILAFFAWPVVAGMLPEIGEVAAEGAAMEMEGALGEEIAAEIAAEEEAAAAQELQEMASKVNPLGGDMNCSWAAQEVDEALGDMAAGRTPDPYAPDWLEPNMPDGAGAPTGADITYTQALEQEYGSYFQESSMERIAEQLEAAGDGARGIVRVAGDGMGHVFNAVNYGGDVFFIDGQTGAVWTSTDILPGGWGSVANTNIWFLPTAG